MSSSRVTTKDSSEKAAHHRLSVLQLAEELGNVSEACRRKGMDRNSYYEWKRRFRLYGFAGLKDLSTAHHTHPETTPPEIVDRILTVSLAHPAWGCNRIANLLALDGIRVSHVTVQKILADNRMGSRHDRVLTLEERHCQDTIELSAEQVTLIEKANPCFRERHIESGRPGELLSQDTFCVGTLEGIEEVYLHAVVDTYGSSAFGFLHTTKVPECAVAVLHNDVLPFYRDRGLTVQAILTDNGTEFCGRPSHPYELYLALNDIEHRRITVLSPQTNGFVERFNRTVLDGFFRTTLRATFYESVDALQQDFDQWLEYYNTIRPHLGYRNCGRRPIDTIQQYLERCEI